MEKRQEICLSGSGGQGIILAGQVLAEAALKSGWYVVQTQSYGPEARGGATKAEVILSDAPVDYPMVTAADLLLAMNQESCDRYLAGVKNNGTVIVDSTNVSHTPPTPTRLVSLPLTAVAREELGKEMFANMVALGVITSLTGEISLREAENALLTRVPPATTEANRKAFWLGVQLANRLV
ncbi:MAG TPA: 2-oxoacid:acceptor oxidoreductase family protein [Spirochaetia bacterium]|nr:2-oxoacid:acceptor oxidoreductase family protein [Spirochaetia bacterium]